jgi:hypothetical protein
VQKLQPSPTGLFRPGLQGGQSRPLPLLPPAPPLPAALHAQKPPSHSQVTQPSDRVVDLSGSQAQREAVHCHVLPSGAQPQVLQGPPDDRMGPETYGVQIGASGQGSMVHIHWPSELHTQLLQPSLAARVSPMVQGLLD